MAYKIKETNEDPRYSVIEKSGLTSEYTLADIEKNLEHVRKVKMELDAKLRIEKAKCTNIETHHPFVLDLTDEQLSTVAMYAESKEFTQQIPARLEEVEKVLENELKEQAHAKKLLGITDDVDSKQD